MIPIPPYPEPDNFDSKVRQPGQKFLQKVSAPKTKDWKNKTFWTNSLSDLCQFYDRICAYSAQWIPRTEGSPTVDHFIPKSINPDLAYEWTNFRLSCLKMNSRKRDFLDVLDPFTLPLNCFILEFPSLIIKPNPTLSENLKEKAIATIARLKLNQDDDCIQGRQEWLIPYCQQEYPLNFLRRKAPFIVYELERQDLVEVSKIARIMRIG